MFKHLRSDIPSSIVVFLVALPLCLGIALASGAPLLSGIISGIVGGIVVGIVSQSHTSVSGPAAGLSAVVLASITQLGGFDLFLTAVILAGIFQLAMGAANTGFLSDYVPSNVIKGLLSAIGIILILKQIPHALGFDSDPEEDFSFIQPDGENTFSELINALNLFTPGAIVISALSILVLIGWDKTPLGKSKFLPAPLFVVLFGIVLNWLFGQFAPYLALEPLHLVNIPPVDTANLSSYIHLPTLSHLSNYHVWTVAITIALVASLETLLNIEAVDRMDPHKRYSPPNRELWAQGVGNVIAGFVGGLPLTSVVVRSSVNIEAGAATKLSAILHGVLMLACVLLIAPLLNLIPLSALAAILLMTGYKLAKISLFKEMYRKGWAQFIPFITTVIAIVFTDLLIGILIGLAMSAFFLLLSNYQSPFIKGEEKLHIGEVMRLELASQVSFLNKARIKETLWTAPEDTKILIDAKNADFIDHDVIELINDFKNIVAPEKNIQINIVGLKEKYQLSDHIQFINVLDKETQQKLRPDEILALLKEGNERFVNGKWQGKDYRHQVNATSMGQNPMAVIIGCIDSRTSPEIIFDAGLGDFLTIRLAGNIISPEVVGSIEIAVEKLGAKLIVVKGHSECGAVAASLQHTPDKINMATVTAKIHRAVEQCDCSDKNAHEISSETIEKITRLNVQNSIDDIINASAYLKKRLEKGEIGLVAAYHDVHTGKVYFED